MIREPPTTSALGLPSGGDFSRHCPVQYIDSGDPLRLMGDIVLPYHDSFSTSVEMESDFFDLVLIGDLKSKVPADVATGDART